ncbi:MAG: efflux RND transporter permease subunit, partial [Schwartzia sp.]|nr:efflux RND transporter permease subunit [Schwartzia sp. (in: firmicutes)]
MIETFIKRPVFTTMFILVLVVFGIRSYPELGVDLYPDVDLPLVGVTVTYEGTAPEEMETLITKPIENRVSQVSGIKTITSTIREGFSQTVLEFDIGVDPKAMASEVREKVATVRRRLPDDIDEPTVQNFDTSSQAIAAYTFASDVRPPQEVRRLVDDLVVDELQQLDGVAEATVVGASSRAMKIHVLPEKLKAYGISIQTVLQQVNAANYNTPGGKIRDGQNTITVRTVGKFYSIDDFKQIVVASHNGKPVMLTDVADVEDTWVDEETFSRANGVPCVIVFVRKQSRTNTVDVIDRVNATLKTMQENDLPPDIRVDITRDQSHYIRENVADVWNTILFGGFLALAITYMFLQDLRATIIGGLAIPTSIVATFYLMRLMDFTLNNMSLMGLSLAVGFLIDDAIVLVENVFRHIEMGKKPMAAAADATKELVLAILATSMSLMAVFVPIGSMGEIVGQYFKQFGLTVAFALAFSTMSAYTLTPMVSAYWLKDPTKEDKSKSLRPPFIEWLLERFEAGFDSLREFYDRVMKFAVDHPKKFIAASFATLLLNFLLFPFLGIELQPVYDSGEFSVNLKAPPGTSLERMSRLIQPLEEEIASLPEVRVAATRVGGVRTPVNEGGIDVKLYPASERKRSMQEIMSELRRKFSSVGEMQVAVVTNQGGGGCRGESRPVQIGLRGSDLEYLMRYANGLADMIRGFPGATDVEIQGNDAEPEIVIRLDQLKASRLGLDNSAVGSVVQYAFQGKNTRNSYTIGNNDYNIIIQMEKANRRTVDDVKNLRVSTTSGSFIRLGDIAEVTLESGPTRINREGRQRQIAVYADTVGTSPGDLLQKIQSDYIPALNMDIGYRAKMIGQSDMMSRIFGEVVKAIVLAIVLIYM